MTARDVDAVIVGGGHNGLVAAAYLGRAGLRVRLLERLPHVGGAAVSAQVFDGVDARLSRYAYLVSLLPARILDDLGATVRLAPRPYSSYTPDPATAGRTGLLIGPRSTFDAIDAHGDERA
ncbi:MAG TPA: NAD(P)-binding protein, partial [Mycobacterium sp.]|nr:NAD(P)-binding protein [Mycobacterium sp.]